MIVIADSTPLNYLILIHQADLLPQLFDRILIPPAVFQELQHQETPDVVRDWIASPPSWLQVQALRSNLDPALGFLDAGEREAIALEELHADQLLLDDADARREASRRNLPFIGTLGVFREAARRELLDLRVVLVQLQECPPRKTVVIYSSRPRAGLGRPSRMLKRTSGSAGRSMLCSTAAQQTLRAYSSKGERP